MKAWKFTVAWVIVMGLIIWGAYWWLKQETVIPADEDNAVAVREAEMVDISAAVSQGVKKQLEKSETHIKTMQECIDDNERYLRTTTNCDDPTGRVLIDTQTLSAITTGFNDFWYGGPFAGTINLSKEHTWHIDHDTDTEWIVITVGDTELDFDCENPVCKLQSGAGYDLAQKVLYYMERERLHECPPVECEREHVGVYKLPWQDMTTMMCLVIHYDDSGNIIPCPGYPLSGGAVIDGADTVGLP